MENSLWMIWLVGLMTGGMGSFLGCCIFADRILKDKATIKFFMDKSNDQ